LLEKFLAGAEGVIEFFLPEIDCNPKTCATQDDARHAFTHTPAIEWLTLNDHYDTHYTPGERLVAQGAIATLIWVNTLNKLFRIQDVE